ncbi:MAG: SAP domain-containing protein [Streptosporangiaceae bacterium]|jgi:hypothetical protein
MSAMTRQYSETASRASGAAERAVERWEQRVGKVTDRFPALVPRVDLVPAVEHYFDFVQRAVDMNRDIAVRWARAVGTVSGTARERAESAGEVEAHRIERQRARQAHEKARARYEGLTKAELSDLLVQRNLPKTGNVDELVERLVEADGK